MTADHSAIFEAYYYDGLSAKRHKVSVQFQDNCMLIENNELQIHAAFTDIEILEKVPGAPRVVKIQGKGRCEISSAGIDAALKQAGFTNRWIETIQNSWKAALLACIVTIGLIGVAYIVLLPKISYTIAYAVPANTVQKMGADTLEFMDKRIFTPSKLPLDTQKRLQQKLAQIHTNDSGLRHELKFRASKRIGPNAFALPDGTIVLTDEMYKLLNDETAVLGVLAHELGHVEKRHLLRQTIQGTVTGAVAFLIFGDASIALSGLTASLLQMTYSREFEREADRFAIETFQRNKLPLERLLFLHKKLIELNKGEESSYLSSHPSTKERIELIENAAKGRKHLDKQ